jgi:hypothetical protein
MTRFLVMTTFLALAGALSVDAGTVAYSDPSGQGTQGWGGNLALNFNVNSNITITDLGVFNASGSGVIAGQIQVVIWDTSTNQMVTPVVTFSGTYATGASGFDVFQSITPVVLAPGSYQVDAVGFSGVDQNGNLNTGSLLGPVLNDGGGLLTFTGAGWDYSTTLDQPGSCSTCTPAPVPQNQQFDAGTFTYTPGGTVVPEPATFALLGCGLIAVGAILRRRRVR